LVKAYGAEILGQPEVVFKRYPDAANVLYIYPPTSCLTAHEGDSTVKRSWWRCRL
jgi:hypothetical protein